VTLGPHWYRFWDFQALLSISFGRLEPLGLYQAWKTFFNLNGGVPLSSSCNQIEFFFEISVLTGEKLQGRLMS
jgi:hypothetical protein